MFRHRHSTVRRWGSANGSDNGVAVGVSHGTNYGVAVGRMPGSVRCAMGYKANGSITAGGGDQPRHKFRCSGGQAKGYSQGAA